MHLIHQLLNKHTVIGKDGVGVIVMCGSRFTGRACAHFTPEGDGDPIEIRDLDVLVEIAQCDNPADARYLAHTSAC